MANQNRQFVAAAREGAQNNSDETELEPIVLYIGDHEVEVNYPGSGQMTYLAAISASEEEDIQRWGGFINFLAALMSDTDARILKRALLHEEMDMADVASMVEAVMEAWGARPTTRPSGSSPQRQATGRPSTAGARKRASTPSRSHSADS